MVTAEDQERWTLWLFVCRIACVTSSEGLLVSPRNVCCVDPYVKVLLLFNGQRIDKKKTQIKKKTLNPTFNESFIFDLPAACCSPVPGPGGQTHLRGVRLQFVVYDWDRVTRNEVIGRLDMGDRVHDDDTPAQRHWNEVVNSPRKQVAEWHRLQPWRRAEPRLREGHDGLEGPAGSSSTAHDGGVRGKPRKNGGL